MYGRSFVVSSNPEVDVLELHADGPEAATERGVGERALRESKIQSM
jgi:hypothetical protein